MLPLCAAVGGTKAARAERVGRREHLVQRRLSVLLPERHAHARFRRRAALRRADRSKVVTAVLSAPPEQRIGRAYATRIAQLATCSARHNLHMRGAARNYQAATSVRTDAQSRALRIASVASRSGGGPRMG